MKKVIFLIGFVSYIFYACQHSSKNDAPYDSPRDAITPANSYNEVFFDSSSLKKFIRESKIRDTMASRLKTFYSNRNYEFAWFFKDGIADYTTSFLNLLDDYIAYSGDSAIYDKSLHTLIDSLKDRGQIIKGNDAIVLKTELLLSRQFFLYAHRAYQGRNQLISEELEWFIPRKKINTVAFLDSLIQNKGKNFSSYEPVNHQYILLKNYLLKYYTIEKSGGWSILAQDKKTYRQGDSSQLISQVKRRLLLTGDFSPTDTSAVFTPALTDAVKSFQRRYGYKQSGVLNQTIINEMKRPVNDRIRQILINMERMRWIPAKPTTDYLLVNIPEFRLHAYEKGNYSWSMNIVTGSSTHNTVVFTGTLKYVVFSPYWNVPPGILKNEILPAMSRNKNYLAAHNMEWHGNTVRQKPGPNNSLGLVKFLFPNDYNIYLHDTPAKSLFNEDKRAFSHGCIRLSEPTKLAIFLLRNQTNWDSAKIVKAMHSGKERFVTVKETVPVYIGYFTAWVDREGQLNFRDDIYGHDRKMTAHLFNKDK